ncbi:MAG: CarD family transcriptional regulator, partial [Rhodanobacteraceae bacterium]
RPVLPPAELYLPPQSLRERLNQVLRIDLTGTGDARAADTGTQVPPDLSVGGNAGGGIPARLGAWLEANPQRHVLIAADSPGRREALLEQLAGAQLQPRVVESWRAFAAFTPSPPAASAGGEGAPFITVAPLERGFSLASPALTLFTERELAGERAHRERRRHDVVERDPEAILRDLTELAIRAPIVHVDHGVGRYLGLVTLDVGGMPGEFLAIEYARGDKLYVPVAQLALVSRYSGADDEHAPLHSLGGEAWERAKRRAAEKVRDAAAELLAIHAQRAARRGNAIDFDRALLARFAEGFRFEETPDQQVAIDAVLADLAAPQPMDRVVCGDVGFGKTEVALRAAVAAASAGKQVAVLVPT